MSQKANKEFKTETDLFNAMTSAITAYEKHLEKRGYDPSYFALYLTGYVLTGDFKKLQEIRLNLNATGHDLFQYQDKDDVAN